MLYYVSAFVFVYVALLTSATTAADVAEPCRDGESNFDAVQVFVGDEECTTSPCSLVRGQTARCLISFTVPDGAEILEQKINATVLGTSITTPFPVPDAKLGCDKLTDGSYCPLDAGESATIELAFDVLRLYPKVNLELAIYLLNEAGKEVTCFKMKGDVVDEL